MAYKLDEERNRAAATQAGGQGALGGFATGAGIGAAAGAAAGGIGAIPGAIIGGLIGAAAVGLGSGALAAGADEQAQKDEYEIELAENQAEEQAKIDAAGMQRQSMGASQLAASPRMRNSAALSSMPSMSASSYDTFRRGVYG